MRRSLPLALALTAVAAPAAHADFVTLGSDLASPATIAHNQPNDAVYWNAVAPKINVIGQVVKVELKGHIVPSQRTLDGYGNPWNIVHFQVLRPQSDGKMQVPKDGTSTDYQMPWAGDDNQVTTFNTTNPNDALCVKPGDVLDFATLGGYSPPAEADYPNGTPFRVFASAPASKVGEIDAVGTAGVNNEHTYDVTTTHDGEELLMRYVVATGADARYACQDPATRDLRPTGPGGTSTKPATPDVTLPTQNPTLPKTRILSVAAFCHNTAGCKGTLVATAKGKTIGSMRYTIAGKKTVGLKFKFNAIGRKLFKQGHNKLKVTIVVTGEPAAATNVAKLAVTVRKR